MWTIDSIYVLMLVSGIMGSFGHCLGMCGSVIAAYAFNMKGRKFMPHLLYSLGRITTYSIIGGIMGLTGSFAGVFRSIERFQYVTAALIGLAMIIMGLGLAGWVPVRKRLEGTTYLRSTDRQSGLAGPVIRIARLISEAKSPGAYFPMGLALGFIPCGLLYTAFIAAAGAGAEAGSPVAGFLKGMGMLFLFGFGTLPALLAFGGMVTKIGENWRGKLYKVSAIMMMLMGAVFIYRSLRF